jgi:integration host factor subunit alpha
LNKIDLVDAVYRAHGGLSRQEAAEVVEAILARLKSGMGGDRRVHLSGFGSFRVVPRRSRAGRNPHTGQPIRLGPRRSLVFRPSRLLLEALNGEARGGERPAVRT